MENKLSLDCLKPKDRCIIKEILMNGALSQRLLDMGFLRGTQLEIIRNAPFSDPLEVKIRGSHISLRHDEAKLLVVEKL